MPPLDEARTIARLVAGPGTKATAGQAWRTVVAIGAVIDLDAVTWTFEAPSAGLEPATVGLEVRCSVQLSYEGMALHWFAARRWRC